MKRTPALKNQPVKMELGEFICVALERGLGTVIELGQFATDWQREYAKGEPGFGDETTFEDWSGGLECWRVLVRILKDNGLPRDADIDWSNLRVISGRRQ